MLPYLSRWPWHRRIVGSRVYAARYTADGERIFLHREVLDIRATETIADHVNGDGLDNRRCNLRVATPSQNAANAGKCLSYGGAAPSSRFKGVCWWNKTKPWFAQIRSNGRRYYLGTFATEEEAALAYNAAARRLHGPFARLNDLGGDLDGGIAHATQRDLGRGTPDALGVGADGSFRGALP